MYKYVTTCTLAVCALVAAVPAPLRVTSPAFRNGDAIPHRYAFTACGGENAPLPLSWSGAPNATKSFAVTVVDPDAPKAGGFYHWILFGIPKTARTTDGTAGKARSGTNDFGTKGYGGPCPPAGERHRYVVTVYALDRDGATLEREFARRAITGSTFSAAISHHVLLRGTLVGTFRS